MLRSEPSPRTSASSADRHPDRRRTRKLRNVGRARNANLGQPRRERRANLFGVGFVPADDQLNAPALALLCLQPAGAGGGRVGLRGVVRASGGRADAHCPHAQVCSVVAAAQNWTMLHRTGVPAFVFSRQMPCEESVQGMAGGAHAITLQVIADRSSPAFVSVQPDRARHAGGRPVPGGRQNAVHQPGGGGCALGGVAAVREHWRGRLC